MLPSTEKARWKENVPLHLKKRKENVEINEPLQTPKHIFII